MTQAEGVALDPVSLHRLEPIDDDGQIKPGTYVLSGVGGEVRGVVLVEEPVDGSLIGEEMKRHEELLSSGTEEFELPNHVVRFREARVTVVMVAPDRTLAVVE